MSTPLKPTEWRFDVGRVTCPSCGEEIMFIGSALRLEVRMHPEQRRGYPTRDDHGVFVHRDSRCRARLEFRLRGSPVHVAPE